MGYRTIVSQYRAIWGHWAPGCCINCPFYAVEHRESTKIFHLMCHQLPIWCAIRWFSFVWKILSGRRQAHQLFFAHKLFVPPFDPGFVPGALGCPRDKPGFHCVNYGAGWSKKFMFMCVLLAWIMGVVVVGLSVITGEMFRTILSQVLSIFPSGCAKIMRINFWPPPPTPEFLSKDFCLEPGFGRKFLLRRTWSGRRLLPLQLPWLSLVASLVRIHFSHPESDGKSSGRNSGIIPERPRERSQSVSWNFPWEHGWDYPNPK